MPEDCDEWGRLAYEKEDKELERKERAEKRKREKQEEERRKEKEKREETRGRARGRSKEKEQGKEKPKRERSRSERVLKSLARPQDQDEADRFVGTMTEVDLRKLCQGLKTCGMLEDGVNYLYMEGTPMEQAKKAVKLLKLGAKTIASLSGVEYKKASEGDASSSKPKPPEPAGPPPAKKKSPEKIDVEMAEREKIEAQKKKMREDLKEAKRRREEAEKQDSLSASYSEKDDYEEVVPEEEGPPREGAIVLRERSRTRDQYDESRDEDEGYGQGWNDWNEEEEYGSRGYGRDRSQRRSKGYGKGKGKGKSKSKTYKGKISEKKGKNPRWYQPPKVPKNHLIEKLLKKGDRNQAEWTAMPRNRLTWETLQSVEEDESVSIRVCIKKSPRNTSMNVPPECRHWRKFSVMLPSIDDKWVECERDVQAHDAEEFEEDSRPILFLACLISESCLASDEEEEPGTGRPEEERTRQYDNLGNVLNAFYANSCNTGVAQMVIEDDLLRNCFTKDGNTAERYMALAAAAGTGDLTGRKCKTWTKLNEKSLGTLICLGCKTALSPAGLEVMDDQKSPEKMMKKLDAEYYPQATVVVDEEADKERMKEVIITLIYEGWKSYCCDTPIWIQRHGASNRGIGIMAWTRGHQYTWRSNLVEGMGITKR